MDSFLKNSLIENSSGFTGTPSSFILVLVTPCRLFLLINSVMLLRCFHRSILRRLTHNQEENKQLSKTHYFCSVLICAGRDPIKEQKKTSAVADTAERGRK